MSSSLHDGIWDVWWNVLWSMKKKRIEKLRKQVAWGYFLTCCCWRTFLINFWNFLFVLALLHGVLLHGVLLDCVLLDDVDDLMFYSVSFKWILPTLVSLPLSSQFIIISQRKRDIFFLSIWVVALDFQSSYDHYTRVRRIIKCEIEWVHHHYRSSCTTKIL